MAAKGSELRDTRLPEKMTAIGILDVPKKPTVIRLRWLLVIVCSYLLLSSQQTWVTLNLLHGFIVFYILTNLGLYLLEERVFESTYFYSPVVIFDTSFVTVALVISGQIATDFYLAYFLIIILSTIWQDFRGVVAIAVLATALYGYFLFQTTLVHDPSVYLRIPFLFVISLFYGYFVQIVRFEKALKEEARQEAQDMAMLQSLSQTLPASLDYKQIIGTVREKIISVVKPVKLYILIVDEKKESPRAFVFEGGEGADPLPRQVDLEKYPIVQDCIQKRSPVVRRRVASKLFTSEARAEPEDFSFTTSSAVPIMFRTELHGVLLLGFNEADRLLNSREVQFCQIVAFAMAIALSNAKKYEELQIEAQRRQKIADQLAEANRLKSEFLANTTHELRTPIAAVLGYGDLLMQEVFGPLTEQQKSTLDRLTQNARGMLGLVEDILDFSRLEKGEGSLQVKQREMTSLIDELRLDLAPIEKGKPFRVKYEIADDIATIKTDWTKLKRILLSLLNNALKFTEEGEVKLSISSAEDGTVSFVVSDTGIGIPEEHIPLIFEKFRQLDGSMTRRYGGTGLGLTITKNLVDLLGGVITVESTVGKGSVFNVTIPIRGRDFPLDAATSGNP
jgi:signal transduction histidine kinase